MKKGKNFIEENFLKFFFFCFIFLTFLMINGLVEVNAAMNPFSQSQYRFFENNDGAAVGNSFLAGTSTAATLSLTGQAFRLRMNIDISDFNVQTQWITTTTDSGLDNDGNRMNIVAADANTLFWTARNYDNYYLRFATSTDGGANWSFKNIDTARTVGADQDISLVGSDTIFISYQDDDNDDLMVASSTDGGINWSTGFVDQPHNAAARSAIATPNAETIFITYTRDLVNPGTSYDLLFASSTNGGATWSTTTIDISVGLSFDMAAPDANTIFISYGDGGLKFASSTNGGVTWSTSSVAIDTGGVYPRMSAPDANTIFVTYRGASNYLNIASSTDGALSWSTNVINYGSVDYNSVAALDAENIFAFWYDSDDPLFASSTNGGASWSTTTISYSADAGYYPDIAVVDADNIFLSHYDYDDFKTHFIRRDDRKLKLQYAERSGTCDTAFVGETYADVSATSGNIRFNDNAGVADGATLTGTSTDPFHSTHTKVNQTYVESNNFDYSVADISMDQDGLWDLSLTSFFAPKNRTYCFRIVRGDDSLLKTYSVIPQITTYGSVLDQIYYRWRNNDANEADATFRADEDTALTGVSLDSAVRLRMEVSNEGNASSSDKYILQYGTDSNSASDNWTTVPPSNSCGSSPFCMNASLLTEGAATTNVASGLTDENTTFVAGLQKEDNATTDHVSLDTTNFTELEFSFQTTANASNYTNYYFRLATTTGSDTPSQLDTYSVTPQLRTLVPAPGIGATANGLTEVNVSWDAITGATSYQLKRDDDIVYSGTATSYTDTGLSGGISYTYGIRSVETAGSSDYTSISVQTDPIPSGGGPAAPASAGAAGNTISVEAHKTVSIDSLSPELSAATNVLMHVNSQINFTIPAAAQGESSGPSGGGGSGSHSAKITKIDMVKRIITILFNSEPIIIELGIGETKQVDLDGDDINDVEVTFNDLIINRVDLTITILGEESTNLFKLECSLNPGINDPCKAVYYLTADSNRYVFPNSKIYNSWYEDFSGVKIISLENLAKYSIEGNVTYKPGTRMLKIQTDPKVYTVSGGGLLRWVETEDIAKGLYGDNWYQMIDDVSPSLFTNYIVGSSINNVLNYNKQEEFLNADIEN